MKFQARYCALLPILVAFAAGCGSKPGGESDDKAEAGPAVVEITQATTKDIATTVSAQGVIAAVQGSSVKLGAISAGRIANVFVKEGDMVEAGQIVAVLENKMQVSNVDSAAAALTVAESQAKESELNAQSAQMDQAASVRIATLAFETAKAERASTIKQATFDLQTARLELKKALSGNRPQEIAQAEQVERQAQVTKDAVDKEEKRNAYLLDRGVVSQKVYDDSKAALQNASASLSSAQAQLSLMREGPRTEDKQTAQLKFEAASQTLKSAQLIQDQKVLQAETALHQAEHGVLQVQAKRQEAEATQRAVHQKSADAGTARATQAQLDIRSPIAGRVVRRYLNPGDTPDNNSPILEVFSPKGGLDLVANVPAVNADQIKVSQKAKIAFSSKSTSDISGTVINIGQVDPQSGMLSMRIRIASPPGWLLPGTFATANIVTHLHTGAVVVPKSAVLTRDGASIVFVANGEKAVLTKIEIGAEQDGFVEVVKGLDAGKSVVTLGNYELADGGAIKTAAAESKADNEEKAKGKAENKPATQDSKKDDEAPNGAKN